MLTYMFSVAMCIWVLLFVPSFVHTEICIPLTKSESVAKETWPPYNQSSVLCGTVVCSDIL